MTIEDNNDKLAALASDARLAADNDKLAALASDARLAADSDTKKWAMVLTHLLAPNMVQGYPVWASSAAAALAAIEQTVANGQPVHIYNEAGTEIELSIVVGAGMTIQIRPWDAFKAQIDQLQAVQRENALAQQFGVAPRPNGGRRPRG